MTDLQIGNVFIRFVAGVPAPNLLRLLLRFHRLDLPALALDFPLLLIQLRPRLSLPGLLVLHRVAHGEPANAAESPADCSARAGSTHRRADYCASSRTQSASEQRALFPRAQRLSAASRCSDQHRQTEQPDCDTL